MASAGEKDHTCTGSGDLLHQIMEEQAHSCGAEWMNENTSAAVSLSNIKLKKKRDAKHIQRNCLFLYPPLQWVFKWRLQAEEGMRASGKPGMSDAQIADFVARFMPAYKAYLPVLYSKVSHALL